MYRARGTKPRREVAIKVLPSQLSEKLGIHGWIHEWTATLERDDEGMLMERSLDTLEELGGKRPVGIRTGSWSTARTGSISSQSSA